jgi:hypothetical protein
MEQKQPTVSNRCKKFNKNLSNIAVTSKEAAQKGTTPDIACECAQRKTRHVFIVFCHELPSSETSKGGEEETY